MAIVTPPQPIPDRDFRYPEVTNSKSKLLIRITIACLFYLALFYMLPIGKSQPIALIALAFISMLATASAAGFYQNSIQRPLNEKIVIKDSKLTYFNINGKVAVTIKLVGGLEVCRGRTKSGASWHTWIVGTSPNTFRVTDDLVDFQEFMTILGSSQGESDLVRITITPA